MGKTETLGMPFGTASSRLRKAIMFMLAQKCNMDICIRCGKKIETLGEFSVDHIKAWENVSVELFWDLSNIGFAHHRCNCQHKRPATRTANFRRCGRKRTPVIERMQKFISHEPNTGCWLWTGFVTAKGYGRVWTNGTSELAHRVMYRHEYGDLPSGAELNSICNINYCVNPVHWYKSLAST